MPRASVLMHYQCKLCPFIVANRNTHLLNWHDDIIDRFTVRKYEGIDEDCEKFYSQYFIETVAKLTSKSQYNYNPSLKHEQ